MSLAPTHLILTHTPCYILDNFTMASIASSTHTSNTPSSNPFILCTITPVTPTHTLIEDCSDLDSDNGIPMEGIDIANPLQALVIPCLPAQVNTPHLAVPQQVFAIHNKNPHFCIHAFPSPLHDLRLYQDLSTNNSIYHLTVAEDKAPIILNQLGLRDARTFLFYLQQVIFAQGYQVFSGLLNHHQAILLANLIVTSCHLGGLINLSAMRNDMINF